MFRNVIKEIDKGAGYDRNNLINIIDNIRSRDYNIRYPDAFAQGRRRGHRGSPA